MFHKLLLSLILVLTVSCVSLKYNPDLKFLNSAQANSPEVLVRINSSVCKDIDNGVGLCAKRIASDKDILFKLDKRPYSYRINVECSSSVSFSLSKDIPSNEELEFKIQASQFASAKSFTCIGEIFPQDRRQEISAMWHVRFVVFDKNYRAREEIYTLGDDLILGQHSKYVILNDDVVLKKKTKVKSADVKRAYTESEQMRINYYGY